MEDPAKVGTAPLHAAENGAPAGGHVPADLKRPFPLTRLVLASVFFEEDGMLFILSTK